MKVKKDWKVMEFCVPIKEALNDNDDFVIRGIAINETTTRNGITYVASELESAAPSFRNKPILVDHSASINDIVGRTTENVVFNSTTKAIEFEGKIMDKKIKEMINDGRITDVSIGAKVSDLVEDEDAGTITAVGLEGLELSLVAVPGDPGAGLANALSESFKIKEMQMNGQEVDLAKDDSGDEGDTELNNKEEEKMDEAEKEVPEEETVEEPKVEEPVAEEKVIKVDMTEANKSIAALAEVVGKLAKKVQEDEEAPAPTEVKAEGEDESPAVEDETVGEVGGEAEEAPAETEEGFVVEKADTGKGFQIYRDYSRESGKFNRLCR